MPETGYPSMPAYSNDQAAYIRQMHEWHTKMVHFHEEQRKYHAERAQQLQQLMGGKVFPLSLAKRKRQTR